MFEPYKSRAIVKTSHQDDTSKSSEESHQGTVQPRPTVWLVPWTQSNWAEAYQAQQEPRGEEATLILHGSITHENNTPAHHDP